MKWQLLVALLLLPLATAQADTNLDVAGIDIVGPAPTWTFGEAVDTSLEVTIRNNGATPSEPYVLRLEWRQGGSSQPLNEDEDRSLDLGASLAAGATRVHDVPWRLQPGQVGQGSIVVRIEAADDVARSQAVFVPSRDWQLNADQDPVEIGSDGTGLVAVQVQNDGNVAESIRFTLDGGHPRLQDALSDSELDVPPGAVRETRIILHFPFDNDLSSSETVYELTAVAESLPSQSATTGAIHIDPLAAPPQRESSLQPTSLHTRFVAPGDATTTAFQLRNDGTAAESYTITAFTDGWLGTDMERRVGLLPGEQTTIHATATAPDGLPGTPGAIGIVAVAGSGGDLSASVPVRLHGPAPGVTAVEVHGPGPYVDDVVPVRVQITNHGDAVAQDIELEVTLDFPDQSPKRTVTVDVLETGRSTWVETEMASPAFAGPGIASARVIDDPGEQSMQTAFVVQEPTLTVVAPEPLQGYPGEAVRYHGPPHAFKVHNDGSHDQEIQLSVSSGAVIPGSTSFSLAAGASMWVPVTHHLPDEAQEVVLTAALADAPHRFSSAGVTTSILDDVAPVVTWLDESHAKLGRGQAYSVHATVDDVSAIDAAWAAVRGPSGAVSRELASGPIVSGLLPLAEPGTYQIQVFARDSHGNVGKSSNRTVDVIEASPPVITDLDVEVDGYNVSMQARVTGNVTVHVHLNGTGPIVLEPVDGRIHYTVELPPGNHTFTVVALDANGLQALDQVDVQIDQEDVLLEDEVKDQEAPMPWVWWVPLLVWAGRRR